MLGQQRDLKLFQKLDLPNNAVAAFPGSVSSAAFADSELVESYWIPLLQYFGIGDGGVGHVGVNGRGAVVSFASAGAAADGLVVAEGIVAEEEVVHGALGAGLDLECFEDGVDEALAGLDIAADYGGTLLWICVEGGVEEALGEVDIDLGKESFVEGDGALDPEAEGVEEGALDDGGSGVEVSGKDGAGAGEVDVEAAVAVFDFDLDGGAVVEVFGGFGVGEVGGLQVFGQGFEALVFHGFHLARDELGAVGAKELIEEFLSAAVGCELGVEVGEVVAEASSGVRGVC